MSDLVSGWRHSDAFASFLDSALGGERPPDHEVLPTGLGALDERLCGGLRAGSVTVVAGVPGVGTSTFCLGIARHTAFARGLRTVFLAPDSADDETFARIVSAEALIPLNHLRDHALTAIDVAKLRRREQALRTAPLMVLTEPHDAAQIEAAVAHVEAWISAGARLVILDGTYQAEPVTRRLVAGIKNTARGSNAAVVIATKILMPDDRRSGAPVLEDLVEYRAIADLCDLVLGLHRPDMHDPESLRPAEADIGILKNRYGGVLPVTVLFQGHYARFVDIARFERMGP